MRPSTCLAVVCGMLAAPPALADFTVCNKADASQSVAVAYKKGDDWVSEGWWNIDVGDCKTVISGDLSNRYYYYRATVKGGGFSGEDYWFCTTGKAFTITGKGNCEPRGFREEEFSEVDTGTTATTFTLNLVPPRRGAVEPPTKAESQASPAAPQPGALGEPFSVDAVFQGCDRIDGNLACTFHAEGVKWYAHDGGGSASDRLAWMDSLPVPTLLEVSGDMISFGDISVEAAVYAARERPMRGEADNILLGLQGIWKETESGSVWEIRGAEIHENGPVSGESFLRIADDCDGAGGRPGPFLVRTVPEEYMEPYCYFILGWDAEFLELSYVGSVNGATMQFWKQF